MIEFLKADMARNLCIFGYAVQGSSYICAATWTLLDALEETDNADRTDREAQFKRVQSRLEKIVERRVRQSGNHALKEILLTSKDAD
jgi:hypothetical protein